MSYEHVGGYMDGDDLFDVFSRIIVKIIALGQMYGKIQKIIRKYPIDISFDDEESHGMLLAKPAKHINGMSSYNIIYPRKIHIKESAQTNMFLRNVVAPRYTLKKSVVAEETIYNVYKMYMMKSGIVMRFYYHGITSLKHGSMEVACSEMNLFRVDAEISFLFDHYIFSFPEDIINLISLREHITYATQKIIEEQNAISPEKLRLMQHIINELGGFEQKLRSDTLDVIRKIVEDAINKHRDIICECIEKIISIINKTERAENMSKYIINLVPHYVFDDVLWRGKYKPLEMLYCYAIRHNKDFGEKYVYMYEVWPFVMAVDRLIAYEWLETLDMRVEPPEYDSYFISSIKKAPGNRYYVGFHRSHTMKHGKIIEPMEPDKFFMHIEYGLDSVLGFLFRFLGDDHSTSMIFSAYRYFIDIVETFFGEY